MSTRSGFHPFRTLADVLEYFSTTTNYERVRNFQYTRSNLDLQRVRDVLDAIGNPDGRAPIFLVAGTKGKGSVCAMIASILEAAGFNVGLFSKPHLVRLNERFSINGKEISDSELVAIMNALYPHLERERTNKQPLTFFEIITVIALQFFAQNSVDVVVLEVGLGGRLDSTNVVMPLVSVITSIDYDHTHILGETLEKIAFEKAGIIKPGVPVVSGVESEGPATVIEEQALLKSAPLIRIERDFWITEDVMSFDVFTQKSQYKNLRLRLLGRHQRRNAAVAISAVEVFATQANKIISESQIRAGLLSTRLRGRIEVLCEKPLVILDVAHNPSSLRALSRTLQEEFPAKKIILLMGMAHDKEIERSLREILPAVSQVVFTGIGHSIGADPEKLLAIAQEIVPDLPVRAEPEIDRAFRFALKECDSKKMLCIAGSFYLAGEIAKLWVTDYASRSADADYSH